MSRVRERGFILIGVQVFVLTAFVALGPSYARLHEILSVEKKTLDAPGGAPLRTDVLGVAVARLQTGVPPNDTFACDVTLWSTAYEDLVSFGVVYQKLVIDEWQVTVSPTPGNNPECPAVFTDGCPVVGP